MLHLLALMECWPILAHTGCCTLLPPPTTNNPKPRHCAVQTCSFGLPQSHKLFLLSVLRDATYPDVTLELQAIINSFMGQLCILLVY